MMAGCPADDESSEGADSLHGSPKPDNTSASSIFPLDSYRRAYLDLHQPAWNIHFPLVTECIEAAEEILGGVSGCALLCSCSCFPRESFRTQRASDMLVCGCILPQTCCCAAGVMMTSIMFPSLLTTCSRMSCARALWSQTIAAGKTALEGPCSSAALPFHLLVQRGWLH